MGALPGKASQTQELGQQASLGPGLQPSHVWIPRGCLGVWDPASLLDTLTWSLPLEKGPWPFWGWGKMSPAGEQWKGLLRPPPNTHLPVPTLATRALEDPGVQPGSHAGPMPRPSPSGSTPFLHGALLALSDTCFCPPQPRVVCLAPMASETVHGRHAGVPGAACPAGAVSVVPCVPVSGLGLNPDAACADVSRSQAGPGLRASPIQGDGANRRLLGCGEWGPRALEECGLA